MDKKILITGATGYVGGRLLAELEKAGSSIRCMARRPENLKSRAGSRVEVVPGDVLNPDSLFSALEGVHTAYYLVHSMGTSKGFEDLDRRGAGNFASVAQRSGLKRIIYLGGLAPLEKDLSAHLRSRHEVGEILRSSGVPVIEFQASVVIGSGSLSFEMIRSLVEKLPVMITPRWVSNLAQPIFIGDLLEYLKMALDKEGLEGQVFQIGGADKVSYRDLMLEYARQRGLRRHLIRVPVLSPKLSSLWLGLVTPLYARVGRKLIESIEHSTVVNDDRALQIFGIRPCGHADAIARALASEDAALAQTRWSDALSSSGPVKDWTGVRFGNRILDSRIAETELSSEQLFGAVRRIGGDTGWYFADWVWHLRGALDVLVGGVGLRRGRPHPEELRVGDTIDWWRVEQYEPGKRLRLQAEMKTPGRAWLQFEVKPELGGSKLLQTAIFDPLGLGGILYWYALYPIHYWVFGGMLRSIVAAARRAGGTGGLRNGSQ
ncbi:MAG: SDR family oxidoreductase [Candidatus Omnitrophica bacterium]|nr:SDR family oxidoreductase [Candidatus Omnitrophota bacterium]